MLVEFHSVLIVTGLVLLVGDYCRPDPQVSLFRRSIEALIKLDGLELELGELTQLISVQLCGIPPLI